MNSEDRVAFPPSQYIKDCSACLGGTCHVLNSFMYTLLKALGFQVAMTGCNVDCHPADRVQHVVNLVYGVNEPDDLYLVDPGAWYPTFEALPLHDWEKESKVYHHSYQEIKLIREGDVITRCNRRSKIQLFKSEEASEDWFRLYHFSLKPIDVEIINNDITLSYKDHSSACLLGFSFSIFPEGKAVALKSRKLFIYDESSGSIDIKDLESEEEIADILSVYCKGISLDLVKRAAINLEYEKNFRRQKNTHSNNPI